MTTWHGVETPSVPAWLRQTLVFAGAWHLVLGAAIVLAPDAFFSLSRIPAPNYPQVWQGAGVMTGVMGLGYVIAARDPLRYWPVIFVGFLPKLLAPFGFLWGVLRGELPTAFGTLVVVHDLAWWVPFGLVLWHALRVHIAGEYPRSAFRGSPREAMANALTEDGTSLLDLSRRGPHLVVFLRQSGCIFCRESLRELERQRASIEAAGVRIALVHMGMPDEGEALLAPYALDDVAVVSDPLRELYAAFQLSQGSFGQLFGPRVLARTVAAMWRGLSQGPLHGDALQLPGAFVVSHGSILRAYRHAHAADRPDFVALATGACDVPRAAARGSSAA